LFLTLQSAISWYSIEYDSLDVGTFLFRNGSSFTDVQDSNYYSSSFHAGKAGTVSVSIAVCLFNSGLLELVVIPKRYQLNRL